MVEEKSFWLHFDSFLQSPVLLSEFTKAFIFLHEFIIFLLFFLNCFPHLHNALQLQTMQSSEVEKLRSLLFPSSIWEVAHHEFDQEALYIYYYCLSSNKYL